MDKWERELQEALAEQQVNDVPSYDPGRLAALSNARRVHRDLFWFNLVAVVLCLVCFLFLVRAIKHLQDTWAQHILWGYM